MKIKFMLRFLIAFVLVVVSAMIQAADFRLAMPANQSLVFSIPNDWRRQTRATVTGQPEAGRITSNDPSHLQILITAILPTDASKAPKTRDAIRADVQKAATSAASQAVEQRITVQDLAMPSGEGYYFFATDKAPKPNEYKYMLQGQFVIKELTVVFTALMNGDADAQAAMALAAIRSVCRQ